MRRWALLGMLAGLVLGLTGCIQPIAAGDQTRTAQAALGLGAPPSPATPPPAASTPVPLARSVEEQFVWNRRDMPNGLTVWYAQPLGPDVLRGFSYTGQRGTPCVGYLVIASAGGSMGPNDNGALVCAAQPAAEAVAAVTYFLTSDGQPQTIVFGRLQSGAVVAVVVTFSDNTSAVVPVTLGGFLLTTPGVASPIALVGVDAQGNIVLPGIALSQDLF